MGLYELSGSNIYSTSLLTPPLPTHASRRLLHPQRRSRPPASKVQRPRSLQVSLFLDFAALISEKYVQGDCYSILRGEKCPRIFFLQIFMSVITPIGVQIFVIPFG